MTDYNTDLMKLWNLLPYYVHHVIDCYMGNISTQLESLSNLALLIVENPAMKKIDKRLNNVNDVVNMLRLRRQWHDAASMEWCHD